MILEVINQITDFVNKNHPFSSSSVTKIIGSWENALIKAKIPLFRNKSLKVNCKQCNKQFTKSFNQIQKNFNHFCSRSCSCTYNNIHKTTGFRISKLEMYLQSKLQGYNFDYNNRKIRDGLELDIYIDSIKIAFEISGIIHYKPIYGEEKLKKTQEKDKLKLDKCKSKNVKLYVIKDLSSKFTEKYGEKILSDIYQHIHKQKFKCV